MKVLVTGHQGYIGTVLAPMLLERGHEVSGLDTDLFGECTFTASPLASRSTWATSATRPPPSWRASTPSSTWPACRTTRSATTTPR